MPEGDMPVDPSLGSIRQAVEAKDFKAVNRRVMHRIVGEDRNPYNVSPGFAAGAIGFMLVGALGYGASMYIRVAKPFEANIRPTRTAAEAVAARIRGHSMAPERLSEVRQLVARWQYLHSRHASRNPHLYVMDAERAAGEHVWSVGGSEAGAATPNPDHVTAADALHPTPTSGR